MNTTLQRRRWGEGMWCLLQGIQKLKLRHCDRQMYNIRHCNMQMNIQNNMHMETDNEQ